MSKKENRGLVFSTYTMITLSVFAVGQMMMLLYDPQQLYLFAIVAVLVSIAVIPVVMSTSPGPQQPSHTRLDLRRLFRISPTGTLTCLGSGLANGAFWSLAPAFAVAVSSDISLAAWFMTANVIGGAASQWPIGLLSDRIGRRPVLIGCALASCVVAAPLALAGGTLPTWLLTLTGFAWGAFAFPQYAIAVANANDHAAPSEYVMVSSGLLLMYGVGAIGGPLLASAAMTLLGDAALYLHTAVVHLLVAGYIAFRATQRDAAPEAQHLDFSESLVAAKTTSQCYEEGTQSEAEARAGAQP